MIQNQFAANCQRQNLKTCGTIKKISAQFVEKWRKIREADSYAKSFQLKTKLS